MSCSTRWDDFYTWFKDEGREDVKHIAEKRNGNKIMIECLMIKGLLKKKLNVIGRIIL
jgi:hypothetical protein